MALTQAQQQLVVEAMPMVDILARRMKRRFPEVGFEDFVSVGHEAAVEAARNFDPARGVPFDGFAFRHIVGKMKRNATSETFGSQHVLIKRALGKSIEAPPSDLGLDEALEDTPERARGRAVGWIRRQAAGLFLANLDPQGTSADAEETEIIEREAYAHAREALARALGTLTEQEQAVVQRHYHEGATLQEIANELGVVERTVKRIHFRLKDKLADELSAVGVVRSPEPRDR